MWTVNASDDSQLVITTKRITGGVTDTGLIEITDHSAYFHATAPFECT